MKKNPTAQIALITAASLLISCQTTQTPMLSYTVNQEQPLVDHSPAEATQIIGQNRITYLEIKHDTAITPKEDSVVKKLISGITQKNQEENWLPLYVYGNLIEITGKKKTDTRIYHKHLFGGLKNEYIWEGQTSYGSETFYTQLQIQVKHKKDDYSYSIKQAHCGTTTMMVNGLYSSKPQDTPLEFARIYGQENTFLVYLTQNVNWVAIGRDSLDESLVKQMTPKSSFRELVNLEGQKIQILDDSKALVAEIQGGKYRIYRENLTGKEKQNLLQALSLVESFRQSVKSLDR